MTQVDTTTALDELVENITGTIILRFGSTKLMYILEETGFTVTPRQASKQIPDQPAKVWRDHGRGVTAETIASIIAGWLDAKSLCDFDTDQVIVGDLKAVRFYEPTSSNQPELP